MTSYNRSSDLKDLFRHNITFLEVCILISRHPKGKLVVNDVNSSFHRLNFSIEQCPESYTLGPLVCLSIVLGTLSLGTITDNCLMVMAVALVRRLQTPCNMLILNLAVTDLLVGVCVIPLASIYQIMGYWIFSELMCDVFILFDVLLCTSSILNLCAISVDRYLVITQPFKYAVKRTRSRMLFMIAIVWSASGLISIPPLFGWRKKRDPFTCEYSDDLGYQIYATFIAFYLPLVVMLILYGRIFRLATAMLAAEARQKRATGNSSTDLASDSGASRRGSYVDSNINNNTVLESPASAGWNTMTNQILRPLQRKLSWRVNSTNHRTENSKCEENIAMLPQQPTTKGNNSQTIPSIQIDTESAPAMVLQTEFSGSTMDLRPEISSRKSSSAHNTKVHKVSVEVKAVRTLGIIMGCFTVCWLPFFLVQLFSPLFQMLGIEFQNKFATLCCQIFYWLGYTNSFLNPLIYAKFNREFRRPFLQILQCHCRHINTRLRSQDYNKCGGNSSVAPSNSRHYKSTSSAASSKLLPGRTGPRRPSSVTMQPSSPMPRRQNRSFNRRPTSCSNEYDIGSSNNKENVQYSLTYNDESHKSTQQCHLLSP